MQIVDKMTHAIVAEWMRDVMATHGWTARHWAELAETSHSNIIRVMSPAKGSEPVMPRLDTLGRLARIAGSQPNLLRVSQRRAGVAKTAGQVHLRVPASAPRRYA